MFIPGDIDNRDTSKAYFCGIRWFDYYHDPDHEIFEIGMLYYSDGEWCFNGYPLSKHLSHYKIVCDFCIEVDRL